MVAANTIIVTGSKGGVGTTTVALNFSVQLAALLTAQPTPPANELIHPPTDWAKRRVLLIDLARPIGQVALMLDLEPRFTVLDVLERIDRLEERLLASMAMRHKTGIDILPGPLHAPMKIEQRQSVTLQAISTLIQIADRTYDFVIVDIGVVNAAEWAAVLREAETILLVTEPSPLALGMVASHIGAASAAGIDDRRIRVVANRWRQGDDGALADFEKNQGRAILSRLPNDYRQLTEVVKLGMPVTGSSSNLLLARYKEMASWVARQAETVVQSAH